MLCTCRVAFYIHEVHETVGCPTVPVDSLGFKKVLTSAMFAATLHHVVVKPTLDETAAL